MNPVRRLMASAKRRYLHQVSDYYFISFPKSGRTWTKSVLANYYALTHDVRVFHDFAPVRTPAGHAEIPRIIFTHANHLKPDAEAEGFIRSLRAKKVVLLVRDPAETTQSFYYRLRKRKNVAEVQSLTLDQFVVHPNFGMAQVLRFLTRWHAARDSFAGFHLHSYERCVADSEAGFASLLDFLGADVDPERLRTAIDRSLDTTRKIEEGGAEIDQTVRDDIAAGDAVYLGRENASALKRFDGSGASLHDLIGPDAREVVAELLLSLDPNLADELDRSNSSQDERSTP